jgi:hypothetical protein
MARGIDLYDRDFMKFKLSSLNAHNSFRILQTNADKYRMFLPLMKEPDGQNVVVPTDEEYGVNTAGYKDP